MSFLKNLGFESKIIGGFGFVAVIFSFIIGLISGVELSSIMLRIPIVLIIFAGMGYGVIIVLKKFVPELYDSLSAGEDADPENTQIDADGTKEEAYVPESNAVKEGAENTTDSKSDNTASPSEEFQELSANDYQAVSDSELGIKDLGNSPGDKLGKHVIVDEKFGNYEPKIMAEAVRTMMSKDED